MSCTDCISVLSTEAQLSALPDSDLRVPLPPEFARQLHHHWAAGVNRAYDEEQRSFQELRAHLEELQRAEEEKEAREALLRNGESTLGHGLTTRTHVNYCHRN